MRDDDGRIVGAVEVTLDKNRSQSVEEALAREKEHLAVTLASIGDGVVVTDTNGTITFINRAAETLSGWARADAPGQKLDGVFKLIDERTRMPRMNPPNEVLRTGVPASLPACTVLLSRDGAEKRRLEEEIVKSQKLESLGVLAGGIAHDFNNILTAIMRARTLTQQLLTFSKGGAPIKKITPLNDIIRDAVPREAMLQGGTITIRTEDADITSDTTLPLSPRKRVKISIQDQGIGISREDMSKIFDPYYTTKAEQHNGLGLAVAYFVVRKHDGRILVDSEPDVATTFSIYLPAAQETEAEVHEPAARVSAPEGRGRILVMDDEEIVRGVLGKILERFGYEAAFARHGMEAIDKYRDAMESGNPFDVFILDLTVTGGMGGREAIELLRLVDPRVTAIVPSGYSDDFVMSDHRKYGFDGVIAKPYRADELSEVLAKVLSRRGVKH